MKTNTKQVSKKALVYCRVSSERQVKEGNGLNSQEKRCRDFAQTKGYPVIKVFKDEGISGGKYERPAITEMINFLDANPLDDFVVLIDDLSRLARDVGVHIQLMTALRMRNVSVECPNFNFEDSPESEFAEMVMASANQLTRKQNRRQVIQKQKARLEQGFWCFCPPKGYRYTNHKAYKKLLTPNEPYSTVFTEMLHAYESDQLNTLEECRAFVSKRYRDFQISDVISLRGVEDTLKNILYAGYIEYPHWKIERTKAHHKPLLTLESFENIQQKLAGKSKKRLRSDYRGDFPLRGFVVCAHCGNPLTASYNTGRSQRYPNYWCKTVGCHYRYKSVPKGTIEPAFEGKIANANLDRDYLDMTRAIFLDVWANKKKQQASLTADITTQIQEMDRSIDSYVKLAGSAKSPAIVAKYEEEIEKLINEKNKLTEDSKEVQYTEKQLGIAMDKVFGVLEDPLGMWKSNSLDNKQTVVQMYFDNKIPYDVKSGFGTATFCDEINLLWSLKLQNNHLVEMAGIEPAS